ncbi:MAG: DUF1439 domain-containing protein [Pseudomonadota bacterium]
MQFIQRRQIVAGAAQLLTLSLAATWLGRVQAQAAYKISKEKIQQAVAERFPRKYPARNLFDITLQTPQLRMLPDQNRLGVQTPVDLAGQALNQSYKGMFDVDFGLRFEPSDLSIRATRLKVNALRFDNLAPGPAALLSAYGPQLAEQSLQDVVLHQLKPADLALPDGMGLQPDKITVTAQGIAISFAPKPLSQPLQPAQAS